MNEPIVDLAREIVERTYEFTPREVELARALLAQRKVSNVSSSWLATIEKRGLTKYFESIERMRAKWKRPPLTAEQKLELDVAYTCGARDIEGELVRNGTIKVVS